jgi:hypothetical protein
VTETLRVDGGTFTMSVCYHGCWWAGDRKLIRVRTLSRLPEGTPPPWRVLASILCSLTLVRPQPFSGTASQGPGLRWDLIDWMRTVNVAPKFNSFAPRGNQRAFCMFLHSCPVNSFCKLGQEGSFVFVQLVMDRSGESRFEFDPSDETGVAEAMRRFNELTRLGYTAAERTGLGTSRKVTEFDRTAAEVLFKPRIVGG